MTRMTREMLARAEGFVWLTGRVLDQRRFACHFGSGSADGVRRALDAYHAPDGGFAFGLEPDVRGPASQPQWSSIAASESRPAVTTLALLTLRAHDAPAAS